MKKLFLIGNGFDISHQMKTSYSNFREFLIKKYDLFEYDFDEAIYSPPESVELPNGGIEYSEDEVVKFLIYIIDQIDNSEERDWSELEKNLCFLNFDDFFINPEDFLDKDGDLDFWGNSMRNEDISSNLIIPTSMIQHFFSEWIQSISVENVKSKNKFNELINQCSLFLSFNYTQTLEKIYSVNNDNICYIHGNQNEEIHFGHGCQIYKYDSYMVNYLGAENNLSKIDELLRKDTSKILRNHIDFFNSLNEVEEVYSYGFSYGKVDDLYIKTIIKNINSEKVTWYLHDYDKRKHSNYKSKINSFGFKGKFKSFHID